MTSWRLLRALTRMTGELAAERFTHERGLLARFLLRDEPIFLFYTWSVLLIGLVGLALLPVADLLVVFYVFGVLFALVTTAGALFLTLLSQHLATLGRVIRSSGTIAQRRARHQFDLLRVLPIGVLGVVFALHQRTYYPYEPIYGWQARLRVGGWTLALALLVLLARPLLYPERVRSDGLSLLLYLGATAGVALFYTLDYVSSHALGLIVAVTVGLRVGAANRARVVAALAYLVPQIPCYLLTLAVAFIVYGMVIFSISFSSYDVRELLSPAERFVRPLLLAYAFRELVIFVLWRWLRRQLELSPHELDDLMRSSTTE